MRPEWEYRQIHLSDLPRKVDEIDLLNDAGEDGWELVGIASNNVAYLKRQMPGGPAAPTRSARRKTNADG
jgi:hypothetical protein